jgi:hypothetical protein
VFTLQQKLDCVERELQRRRRHFPVRVANRRMSQRVAEHELELMRAVVEDYAARVADERLSARISPSLSINAGR